MPRALIKTISKIKIQQVILTSRFLIDSSDSHLLSISPNDEIQPSLNRNTITTCFSSTSKQLSLFTYNEGGPLPRSVLARRRASDAAKSPSPSPSMSTCATKPFEAQNGHDAAAATAGTEALDRRLKEEKLGAGQQTTTTTTTQCNGEIRAERLEREDRKSEALATATAAGPNVSLHTHV